MNARIHDLEKNRNNIVCFSQITIKNLKTISSKVGYLSFGIYISHRFWN